MAQLGWPESHWQAPRGAWPEDRLPELLARLERLLNDEAEREARDAAEPERIQAEDRNEAAGDSAAAPVPDVRLAQRSWPLKRLIEAAIADNVPILWER